MLLCPTVLPQDVAAAASRLAEQGVGTIDRPMSSGPQRAREGSISLMVAGEGAVVQRNLPLLKHPSSRLFLVGTRPRDGARTKLVNNLLAAANLAAAAEALALAQRLGLDAAATLAVIEESRGHSWIASDRARRLVAGNTTALARMTLLAKDSALALAVAQDAGVDNSGLPVSTSAAATFAAALQDGLAYEDGSALFRRALWRLSPPSAAAAP